MSRLSPRRARRNEGGYAMAALLAAVTIMLIVMAAALPSWKYVIKNDREEELLFRGNQIASAIERFQKKRGNLLPTSIDLLVREKFLRRAYKDPMTKDGRWRLVRPGEPAGGPVNPFAKPGASPTPKPLPTPSSSFGRDAGAGVGPFVGVASHSTETSLRLFNNQDRYDLWRFVAGQPRIVGKPPQVKGNPASRPNAQPGGASEPQKN